MTLLAVSLAFAFGFMAGVITLALVAIGEQTRRWFSRLWREWVP